MKRFIIKFLILFAIIDGYLFWYRFFVYPNISGDMGYLAKLPFGKAYNEQIVNSNKINGCYVSNIYSIDSIPVRRIVTIGDSFSQQDTLGYQQYLGHRIGDTIFNIPINNTATHSPEQTFVRLVNRGLLDSTTNIVIIQSVERSMLGRLSDLNFIDTTEVELRKRPIKKTNSNPDYVGEAMHKMRLLLGYRRPILKYDLSKPLFTHPKYSKNIYIYHSPFIGDTDLNFPKDTLFVMRAYENLEKLYAFATQHSIRILYLIAPDKYDVYYPYILNSPGYNMTLDFCPQNNFIVNPKTIFRRALEENVQDVYYINDTHWSPIGSKIIGEEVAKRIKDLYLSQE